MTDFKEEAYVLEKIEISEDEDDGFEYKELNNSDLEIEDSAIMDSIKDDDDDLNDFNALKAKTELKKADALRAQGLGAKIQDYKPKLIERDVVIDDFIRNFLSNFDMGKTLNTFQQEWNELQKKGTFHDV